MKHSQCLFYALDKWHAEGGYLVLGKSTHWIIPHVLHMTHERRMTHFAPPADLRAPWYALFGFAGSIIVDDHCKREPMSKAGMVAGTMLLLAFGLAWAVRHTLKRIVSPVP